MKFIAGILGMILAIPILLTLVVLVVVTLIGGYIGIILEIAWQLILAVLVIILLVVIIKKIKSM